MEENQHSSALERADYSFTPTQDWFSGNIPAWRSLLPLVKSPNPRVLEIGAWEGRSSVFLLNELCTTGGELVCIDHFDLMQTVAGRARHAAVMHNLGLTGKPFRVVDDFSAPALMKVLAGEMQSPAPGFDWLYIDGSHEADDTFLDGELAWRLTRKGAIFIFDDYHWDKEPENSRHHPKLGVDAFMTLHDGEYERLSGPGQYQMILRKTSEMRIGFLSKEAVGDSEQLHDALGYGINIALTVDSAYALPAAVAIRSAVEHTPGRISVYVVDCGLTALDQQWIHDSMPARPGVTLKFLPLPDTGSLVAEPAMGPRWAKIDMLGVLPVERILYFDADVLVRGDLCELWRFDLQGKPIGAAVDVGFPTGHDDPSVSGAPYFNAGVLLVDLAKARHRLADLKALGRTMRDARFKDQDALNAHFRYGWAEIQLRWNAQGLGTYASSPSIRRGELSLEELCDPRVVHFTGPVHPPMSDVLNPYLQPYTAKPWGYAGAPGHPFAQDWWAIALQTSWDDYIKGVGHEEECKRARAEAIRNGLQTFEVVVASREKDRAKGGRAP